MCVDVKNGTQCVPFLKYSILEVVMEEKKEIISIEMKNFPEFEKIRNAILEAREKVATTVNFAMVAAYWAIGKQLYEAMSLPARFMVNS